MSTALQNITGDLTETIEDIQAANVQLREHTECDAVHQRAARQVKLKSLQTSGPSTESQSIEMIFK